MHPYAECDNHPISIKDADGPFLIMEATLFGGDKLDDEFKKTATYSCSCATVSAAIDICRSTTNGLDDPWYESWEKAVERYPLEEHDGASALYWIEPTDPFAALCAFYPHPDLEPYVVEVISAIDTYLLEHEYCSYTLDHLDLKHVKVLLSAAWGLARILEEAWTTHDPDVLEKIEDATYNAYITVRDLIEGEEAAKAGPKADDSL